MAVRTIKHVSFSFNVVAPDPVRPGESIYVEKKAPRGAVVDIPLDDDLARGHKFGAFVEDMADVTSDAVEVDSEDEDEASVTDMTDEELVEWIKNDKPRVAEVVAAAEGDPDNARRLLAAEDAATGGDSRTGVVNGLTAVITQA